MNRHWSSIQGNARHRSNNPGWHAQYVIKIVISIVINSTRSKLVGFTADNIPETFELIRLVFGNVSQNHCVIFDRSGRLKAGRISIDDDHLVEYHCYCTKHNLNWPTINHQRSSQQYWHIEWYLSFDVIRWWIEYEKSVRKISAETALWICLCFRD